MGTAASNVLLIAAASLPDVSLIPPLDTTLVTWTLDTSNTSESRYCSIAKHDQPARGPQDPNEKQVIAKTFIQPDELLVYPIDYENIGTVEALDVFVTDVLDENL